MSIKSPTLAEAILSRAAGQELCANDVAVFDLDLIMIHDSIAPTAIQIMNDALRTQKVFDPAKIAVGIDHVSPAATVAIAADCNPCNRDHFFVTDRGP